MRGRPSAVLMAASRFTAVATAGAAPSISPAASHPATATLIHLLREPQRIGDIISEASLKSRIAMLVPGIIDSIEIINWTRRAEVRYSLISGKQFPFTTL